MTQSVTEKIDNVKKENVQRISFFTALKALQAGTRELISRNQEIQAIVDGGGFNTIPADVKTILNRWRMVLRDTQTALQSDPEIFEAHNWKDD